MPLGGATFLVPSQELALLAEVALSGTVLAMGLSLRRAFTLVEVVTVVVLLGILAAIGSVTYDSFLGDATDAAAVGRLDTAHVVELRFAATWGRFTPHPGDLGDDTGVNFVAGPASTGQVSIAVGASGELAVATATSEGCVGRRYPPVDEGYAPVTVTFTAPCDAVEVLAEGDAPRDPAVSARW